MNSGLQTDHVSILVLIGGQLAGEHFQNMSVPNAASSLGTIGNVTS